MAVETHAAIYFYGMRGSQFGFLSNFHPCRFQDPKTLTSYKSSEQFFMKRKQETFDADNAPLALAILKAKTPTDAKKLGRQVRNYDDKKWAALRLDVMVDALKLKFSSDEQLKHKLLETGSKMLYEASHSDAIWGIGISVGGVAILFRKNPHFLEAGDVDDATREQCFGQNLLGKALMETRAWLLRASADEAVHE